MNRFYEPWVADGKPFRACTPVAEVIAKMKAARPAAAKAGCFGSIGNYAHLTADVPKDHTPYSQTGWPLPSPYGVGFAVDIMHRPDLGVDCHVIFKHWLAEAKAGRLPWLKYLIWQGKSYSVRNNWEPRDADGHFDHIHASTRTDHVNTHIGDFNPLGEGMADSPQLTTTNWRILEGMLQLKDLVNDHVNKVPQPNEMARILRRIEASSALAVQLVGLLADAVKAGGGNLDTVAVLARIDERAAEDAARDAAEAERDAAAAARIAELEADVARLEAQLAAVPDAVADEQHRRTES